MNITVNEDRTVIKEYEENEGSQNENKITELNFSLPSIYSDFTPKIVFITEDGNYTDYIEDNRYILKNNVTRYRKVKAYVWLTESTENKDFRSELFQLEFNYNEDPSDYIPSEQEKSQIEALIDELDSLIEEVESLPTMSREIVEELPTEDIDPNTIYMVLREDSEPNNIYDEWLYINDEWEKIGSTDINLNDYCTNDRADVIEEDVKEIDNILFGTEEVDSTGNQVQITGDENLEIAVTRINGDTEQESTTGKNRLPASASGSYTSNGATHSTTGNGIYVINNTATGVSYHDWEITPYTIQSGDYLQVGNAVANNNISVALLESTTSQIMASYPTTINKINDLSSYVGRTVKYVRTYTNAQTLDNYTVKPMICSSSTAIDYEQYTGGIAAPNPDFDFPVKSVTGEQTVQIKDENNNVITTKTIDLGDKELFEDSFISYENGNFYFNDVFVNIDLSTISSFTHVSSWANPTAMVAYDVLNHGITGYNTVADIYCNRLIKNTPGNIATSVKNAIGLGDTSNVFLSIDGLTSSSDYVNYFANNETYLVAKLQTPIKTPITDTTLISQLNAIQKLQQLTGTTIVEIVGDNGLNPTFKIVYETDSISYLKDTKENSSNKTLVVNSSSTDSQYPSGKAVYTYVNGVVGNINTMLDQMNREVV
ncbi:MAG: hypothetical protein IJH55_07615 [Romboutsia sp.]|nr:hypothetical protein [Romboutsia sp.]